MVFLGRGYVDVILHHIVRHVDVNGFKPKRLKGKDWYIIESSGKKKSSFMESG
jgi:hypothetical protein